MTTFDYTKPTTHTNPHTTPEKNFDDYFEYLYDEDTKNTPYLGVEGDYPFHGQQPQQQPRTNLPRFNTPQTPQPRDNEMEL